MKGEMCNVKGWTGVPPVKEPEEQRGMKSLTDFCDLMCKYAETPKDTAVDGAGSCRTFVALYCRMKKSLVHKNMPCRQKVIRETMKNEECRM